MSQRVTDPSPESRISGSAVVAAMFLLGIVATGILWTYWHLHLMPFMPLQEALVTEFEGSSPRVDGGRRKIHQSTPMILRVVMRVPFDPTSSAEKDQQLIEDRINKTRELAATYLVSDEYELLEIHMYQESKEEQLRQKTFQKDLKSSAQQP